MTLAHTLLVLYVALCASAWIVVILSKAWRERR